ncbi:MAG: ACT domain-containing protein [Candidatus Hadarchaeales archaeon]
MLVKIVMELEDIPGQLLKALEPIARFGGNIQSIMHQREKKTPLGRIPVMLVFEIKDRARLNKVLAALKARGIGVTQLGESLRAIKGTVILIGHIIHTDIRDTIDRLNALDGVRVSDFSMAVSEVGRESTARMAITAADMRKRDMALRKLEEISRKKNLLLIPSLEEEE